MKYNKPTTTKAKLSFIQKVLKMDMYFFHWDVKREMVMIILESSASTVAETLRFTFSGRNMANAVDDALTYVENEIEAGAFELPTEYMLKAEPEHTPKVEPTQSKEKDKTEDKK